MADQPTRKKGSDESGASSTTAVGSDSSQVFIISKDNIDLLPNLCPPSDEEARMFYNGLPSCPRLVGRASAGIEIWETLEQQYARIPAVDGHHKGDTKALSAIGAHKIIDTWDSVRPKILAAIAHLPWNSVDILRIGSTETALLKRPVVVWIGVDLGNDDKEVVLPWKNIADVIRSCRRILDEFGLGDVDCQLRESHIIPFTGPRLLEPLPEVYALWHYIGQRFTTAIGQSISPFERPTLSGTLGVYLSPDNCREEGRPLWALTCRHVAMPTESNEPYQFQDGTPQKTIGLNSKSNAKNWMVDLEDLRRRFAKSTIATDVAQLHDSVKGFEFDEGRTIGHVLFSPPIGQGFTPFPWTRDWSLLSLYQGKFPGKACPINVVDIRTEMPSHTLVELLNPQPSGYTFEYPEDGLLRISGVVPLAEVRNPKTLDKNGEEVLLVGKRGAVTGLTWGCPSELESVLRHCMPDGSEFTSLEWAIHGSLENKTVPFSGRGDSGAAIFDVQGRLGGFVTRGTGITEGRRVDITYATPAELVLADIEAQIGQKVVLL